MRAVEGDRVAEYRQIGDADARVRGSRGGSMCLMRWMIAENVTISQIRLVIQWTWIWRVGVARILYFSSGDIGVFDHEIWVGCGSW